MDTERQGRWYKAEPRHKFGGLKFGSKAGDPLNEGDDLVLASFDVQDGHLDEVLRVQGGKLRHEYYVDGIRTLQNPEIISPNSLNRRLRGYVVYQAPTATEKLPESEHVVAGKTHDLYERGDRWPVIGALGRRYPNKRQLTHESTNENPMIINSREETVLGPAQGWPTRKMVRETQLVIADDGQVFYRENVGRHPGKEIPLTAWNSQIIPGFKEKIRLVPRS